MPPSESIQEWNSKKEVRDARETFIRALTDKFGSASAYLAIMLEGVGLGNNGYLGFRRVKGRGREKRVVTTIVCMAWGRCG